MGSKQAKDSAQPKGLIFGDADFLHTPQSRRSFIHVSDMRNDCYRGSYTQNEWLIADDGDSKSWTVVYRVKEQIMAGSIDAAEVLPLFEYFDSHNLWFRLKRAGSEPAEDYFGLATSIFAFNQEKEDLTYWQPAGEGQIPLPVTEDADLKNCFAEITSRVKRIVETHAKTPKKVSGGSWMTAIMSERALGWIFYREIADRPGSN